MSLSYGITFLCNCCRKLIIHWKVLYDIFLLKTCKVVIIEKKFQSQGGSVDEKLATFPFKILEYQKLLAPINYNVQYIYLLSSKWFNTPKYQDYYDYMKALGCPYYFDVLPLSALGL